MTLTPSKPEKKQRPKDMFLGKVHGLLPRLAKLCWIKEECRRFSGSAMHGELCALCDAATSEGNYFVTFANMLAHPPKDATICHGDKRAEIVRKYESAAAKFSRAEHRALEYYKNLFK